MSYSYIISYGTAATGPWTQAGTSSVASFSITGLSGGVNYWVRIIAVDTISGLQSSPAVAGPFQTGSVTQESANLSSVTSSSQTIYSSQTPGQAAPTGGPFDTWTITGQGGQVIHNGTTDTTTSAVLQLFYQNHTVYHEESNGNSFGTPGWWQWTGTTTYPSATPGSGSFTDPKGNVWSLNVSGNPVVNGQTDTVSHTQIIYLIGTTVWQFDVSNNWYSLTPTGTITSGSLSWTGPTTTSPITGWAACASPSGVPLTITGISLSNNTVSSTAPSGTTVGAISVTVSSGTFSGSVSLSGSNASSFAVSGSSLTTAASNLTAGNYSVGLTASQASASNSPFGPTPFTIVSQASSGGPGPTAFSPFMTADFSSAYFYPTPGTTSQNSGRGQMIISPRLYGTIDGAFANDGSLVGSFSVANGNPFALLTSAEYQTKMATVCPGLWTELTPPPQLWGTFPNVNPSGYTNLINNFYKVDPLGISAIVLNLNWRDLNITSQTLYGQMIHNMAVFFQNQTMPNGKRLPVIGFCGQNEPANTDDSAGYYNQIVANCKNVSLPGGGTYIVVGPVSDYAGNVNGGWSGFTAATPGMDVFQWDNFFEGGHYDPQTNPGGWPPGGRPMSDLQTTFADYFAGGIRSAATQVAYQPSVYFPAGNMDSNASDSDPAQADYRGAIWDAIQKITSANSSPVTCYWSKWDSALQGNMGFLINPGNQISPAGYANGQQIRTVTGPRWNVTTNAANLLTMAVTPSTGHFGLMVVNAGQGAQNGKTVALSHWPVNSSGNSTANVWQLTSSTTQDGTRTTVSVNAGVTAALNFPDPSITIISI